jgi:hypothetical protein
MKISYQYLTRPTILRIPVCTGTTSLKVCDAEKWSTGTSARISVTKCRNILTTMGLPGHHTTSTPVPVPSWLTGRPRRIFWVKSVPFHKQLWIGGTKYLYPSKASKVSTFTGTGTYASSITCRIFEYRILKIRILKRIRLWLGTGTCTDSVFQLREIPGTGTDFV